MIKTSVAMIVALTIAVPSTGRAECSEQCVPLEAYREVLRAGSTWEASALIERDRADRLDLQLRSVTASISAGLLTVPSDRVESGPSVLDTILVSTAVGLIGAAIGLGIGWQLRGEAK